MRSSKAIILEEPSCPEKTCRNLFGTVDHEQLKIDFEVMMKNMNEENARKWNFDFVTETPLEGTYQWERVDVPNTELHAESNNLPIIMSQNDTKFSDHDRTVQSGSKRKQTLMTDFWTIKRRGSPTSSDKCS